MTKKLLYTKKLTAEHLDQIEEVIDDDRKKVRTEGKIKFTYFFFYRAPWAKRGTWKSLKDWARIKNIKYWTLYMRVNRYGMTIKEAIETPLKRENNHNIWEWRKTIAGRKRGRRNKCLYRKTPIPHIPKTDNKKKTENLL